MNNWFRISRDLFETDLWLDERFDKAHAWIDLIGLANWKDKDCMVDYKTITIHRGDLMTSQVKLAKRWKWDRETVSKFLKFLVAEKMVSLTVHRAFESGFTVISILNYSLYQDTPQGNPQGTPQGNQHNNKKDKKEKNIYTSKKLSREEAVELGRTLGEDTDSSLQEFEMFEDYCSANGKVYKNYASAFRNWLRSPYRVKKTITNQSIEWQTEQ